MCRPADVNGDDRMGAMEIRFDAIAAAAAQSVRVSPPPLIRNTSLPSPPSVQHYVYYDDYDDIERFFTVSLSPPLPPGIHDETITRRACLDNYDNNNN